MVQPRPIYLVSGIGALILALSATAHAITVPDSGTCNTASACFQITQNGSGTNPYAIVGNATAAGGFGVLGTNSVTTGNAVGVYGFVQSSSLGTGVAGVAGPGMGVVGRSTSNIGVNGISTTLNGVVGQTSVTDHSAAAISALSGDAANGLAYWGTGGIEITSNFAQKATAGSWTGPSDIRLKKDVHDSSEGLRELLKVRTVKSTSRNL